MPTLTFDQVKRFLQKNYRYDRLYGRGQEYGDAVVASHLEMMQQLERGELDEVFISKFEHVLGKAVSLTAKTLYNAIRASRKF